MAYFFKLLWNKSDKVLDQEETQSIGRFCKSLTFFNAQQLALSIAVIDFKLFQRIDEIRAERNKIVHLFWLYEHRGNRLVMRKKLEKLARVANDLVGILNKLTRKIGVDDVYEIFL